MSIKAGQAVPNITLPAIDGSQFDSDSLKGKKYLVTLFRFATCPFCNIRMAELFRIREDLGEDFEIVAIFEAELTHLKKYANKHSGKFPILADKERIYYQKFGVKNSLFGMFKGIIMRAPSGFMGILKGYFPREISHRFLTMPLSLLVDEQGIIQIVYHAKDEGDHIPLKEVKAFAQK